MVKRCLINGKLGYYINGITRLGNYYERFDANKHQIIDETFFDIRIDLYKRTLDYLGFNWHKSVVWKEKVLLKGLYGSYIKWDTAVSEMLYLGLLKRNGQLLTKGEPI